MVSRPFLPALAGLLLLAVAPHRVHAQRAPLDYEYVMTYFDGDNNSGLKLAGSDDGYAWTALGDTGFSPNVCTWTSFRDPSFARGPDGTFHLTWTTGGNGFGHAVSTDLETWENSKCVKINRGPLAGRNANTWAPEVYYDEGRGEFVVVFSTATEQWDFRGYYVTTTDFETFSLPELLLDPHDDLYEIDAALLQANGLYYTFTKIEDLNAAAPGGGKDGVHYATAPTLEGPWTSLTPTRLPGLDSNDEGPSPVRVGDAWVVYYDHTPGLRAVRSTDLETWENVSDELTPPADFRHGTVRRIGRTGIAPGTYEIGARHSGRVLDVEGGPSAGADGADVHQWRGFGGQANQEWLVAPDAARPGAYTVRARHSGKCLDVSRASGADGANVIQYRCTGRANQAWRFEPVPGEPDFYYVVAAHSGRVLDVAGASTRDGATVQQWGTPAQSASATHRHFRLTRVDAAPPTSFEGPPVGETIWLRSGANGRYVSADRNLDGFLIANRDRVGQWEEFEAIGHDDGRVSLRARANGELVAVTAANSDYLRAEGTQIGQEDKYSWIENRDGTVSLQAYGGLYVVAASARGDSLRSQGRVLDDEARFTWGRVGETAESPAPASASVLGLPTEVTLDAPYPNPAGARVTLAYGLPEPGGVRVEAFDALGRRVAVLADGPREAGWHQATLDATGLPAGVYLVRLAAAGRVLTQRLTLAR